MPDQRYQVYGLVVSSEIPLDGLPPSTGVATVHVEWGDTPERLGGRTVDGVGWQLTPDAILVTVKRLARFLVSAQGRIIVTPLSDCSLAEVQYALLTAAFGPLLHLRQRLLLHASAVTIDSKAVCFLGRSGAGKSTLALACANRGVSVLTDDLTPILFNHRQAEVAPGPPVLGIWIDALRHFQFQERSSHRVREGVPKFKVVVPAACSTSAIPVQAAIVISTHRSNQIVCHRLLGRDAFMAFKTHTRGKRIAESLDTTSYFSRVSQASVDIPVYQLLRPENDLSRLPEVVDTVLRVAAR